MRCSASELGCRPDLDTSSGPVSGSSAARIQPASEAVAAPQSVAATTSRYRVLALGVIPNRSPRFGRPGHRPAAVRRVRRFADRCDRLLPGLAATGGGRVDGAELDYDAVLGQHRQLQAGIDAVGAPGAGGPAVPSPPRAPSPTRARLAAGCGPRHNRRPLLVGHLAGKLGRHQLLAHHGRWRPLARRGAGLPPATTSRVTSRVRARHVRPPAAARGGARPPSRSRARLRRAGWPRRVPRRRSVPR